MDPSHQNGLPHSRIRDADEVEREAERIGAEVRERFQEEARDRQENPEAFLLDQGRDRLNLSVMIAAAIFDPDLLSGRQLALISVVNTAENYLRRAHRADTSGVESVRTAIENTDLRNVIKQVPDKSDRDRKLEMGRALLLNAIWSAQHGQTYEAEERFGEACQQFLSALQ